MTSVGCVDSDSEELDTKLISRNRYAGFAPGKRVMDSPQRRYPALAKLDSVLGAGEDVMEPRVRTLGRAVLDRLAARSVRATRIFQLDAIVEDRNLRARINDRVVPMHQEVRQSFDHRRATVVGASRNRYSLPFLRSSNRARRPRVPQINVSLEKQQRVVKKPSDVAKSLCALDHGRTDVGS